MAKKLISFDDTRGPLGLPAPVERGLNTKFGPDTPSLTAHEQAVSYGMAVMIHDSQDAYYATGSTTVGSSPLDLLKSTDFSRTWQKVGTLPEVPRCMIKTAAGTLISVENTAPTVLGTTRVWRSADDGATWTQVHTMQVGPLQTSGMCETPTGHLAIAEYSNVGQTQHNLWVSADDGLTWTSRLQSSGTDPQGDPGHLHSVTWDPIGEKAVVVMDRPYNGLSDTATGGPEIWVSDSTMQEWTSLGRVGHGGMSFDCVQPMYFENYIAWASDSWRNGYVGRIKRDDFYAGNWGEYETIARINRTAAYYAFPLRPDVWMVSTASESVHAAGTPEGAGTLQPSVYLVSNDGAVVSNGISSLTTAVIPGEGQIGQPPLFPTTAAGRFDHKGFTMVNMSLGRPTSRSAVPVSQGWEPPHQRLGAWQANLPVLPRGNWLQAKSTDEQPRNIVGMPQDRVTLTNPIVPLASRPEIRIDPDGTIRFRHGSKQALSITDGSAIFPSLRLASSTGPTITAGLGNPEGVVTASPGSLYVRWNAVRGHGLWVKTYGSGNTGWELPGAASSATSGRPADPVTGVPFFDTTLGKPIWWNGTEWVDATGEPV